MNKPEKLRSLSAEIRGKKVQANLSWIHPTPTAPSMKDGATCQ